MKLSKWWGFFPIALLAALTGCGAKGLQKVSAQAPPVTVEVTEAAPGDADIFVEYPGQTYARNMVDVRGRVEGYIEKWLFRPGQEVTAGEPLYILDLRPFQAQVEQAAAAKQDLDAAVAALRSAEASVRANQANVEQTRLTTETQVQSTVGK